MNEVADKMEELPDDQCDILQRDLEVFVDYSMPGPTPIVGMSKPGGAPTLIAQQDCSKPCRREQRSWMSGDLFQALSSHRKPFREAGWMSNWRRSALKLIVIGVP